MSKPLIRTDDVAGFFNRAEAAARRADRGQPFDGKVRLSFEDAQDLHCSVGGAAPINAIPFRSCR